MNNVISHEDLEAFVAEGNFESSVVDLFSGEHNAPARSLEEIQPFWKLWELVRDRACFYPASVKYHGVWVGGLNDHMNDMLAYMRMNWHSYRLERVRAVEMAILVLMHDWDKLWKYQIILGGEPEKWTYRKSMDEITVNQHLRVGAFLQWSGLKNISEEFLNALTMSEGGWSIEAQAGMKTETSPLAALLHAADMFSAKVLRSSPSEWAQKQIYESENKLLYDREQEILQKSPIEKVLWPS